MRSNNIYRFDEEWEWDTTIGDLEIELFNDIKSYVKKEVKKDISGVWN